VKNGWEFTLAGKEPKVCASDLLKSPLNLTDYFLLENLSQMAVDLMQG
jgi:hypothetical protein